MRVAEQKWLERRMVAGCLGFGRRASNPYCRSSAKPSYSERLRGNDGIEGRLCMGINGRLCVGTNDRLCAGICACAFLQAVSLPWRE